MAENDKAETTPPSEGDEAFLARWARRKHRAREGRAPPAEEPAPQPPGEDAGAGQGSEGPADAEASPGDESLPPPASLDADSDFSAYLSARVSSGLRRAALRRLFSLPEFNVRDGLDDYDEDYTSFKSLGDTLTADMKHHAERLRERRAKAAAERGGEDAEDMAAPGADEAASSAEAGGAEGAVDDEAGACDDALAAGEDPDDRG